MAVRRLYEPLCIAFGTTVSSPTVPTYQLYDLPHKFTPRLYMESEDPNLVLREIGVWAGWEQAGSADTRSFLLDLLKDKGAHDNFLLSLGHLLSKSDLWTPCVVDVVIRSFPKPCYPDLAEESRKPS